MSDGESGSRSVNDADARGFGHLQRQSLIALVIATLCHHITPSSAAEGNTMSVPWILTIYRPLLPYGYSYTSCARSS